jgi:hypothetical protein
MKVEVALPERETYGKQLLEGERHSGTEEEASFAGKSCSGVRTECTIDAMICN